MSDTPSINGDLSRRVVVDTSTMDWTASPSATVSRKRVHLVGPPESGQVTSVVRYTAGSSFHAHDHPEGEEILVLDGVFSDEHGDWPQGTYLLNPEGFRHAPFSVEGCTLFVKLRQFPGRDREHVAVQSAGLPWLATGRRGVGIKPLYAQEGFEDETRLERWLPGTRIGELTHASGTEILVLNGQFSDELGEYGPGTWLRLPAGTRQRVETRTGCELYIKTGGFAYLRSAA